MPLIETTATSYRATAKTGRAMCAIAATVGCLGLLQACNASDISVSAVPASAAVVAGIASTATVGAALPAPVSVLVKGPDGRALSGARVRWAASAGGTVSATESEANASGVATTIWTLGQRAGLQELTAELAGVAPVVVRVTAVADRASAIRIVEGSLRSSVLGDTIRVAAQVTDRFGNEVQTAPTIAIESGSDVVAVVGNVLVARARGTAVIRATVDTAVARVNIIVDPGTPVIARLDVDTIRPGVAFAVDGQNFALLSDLVSVSIGAAKATVTRVSRTRIEAVFAEGVLPCLAAGAQSLMVTVGGNTQQRLVPVRSAARIALSRGESASILDAAQVRCTEIVAPSGAAHAKYVLAVVNTSVTAAATSAFELRGTGAGAMAGQVAVARVQPTSSGLLNASLLQAAHAGATAAPQLSSVEQLAEAQHAGLLEAQRAVISRVGSPTPVWRALERMRATRNVAAAQVSSRVGDTVTMKALYGSCSNGRDIKARVVYAGTKALVLEDIAAPRAGQLDVQYRQIGDEFDRVQYPLLQSKIGDPLAMDAAMAGDGRVTMLFTRFVNDSLPGIAGYVTSCNFFSKGTFAGSNEDEVFYARLANAGESPTDWRRSMRSTVMHETKHLASYAERFAQNAPMEEAWLEESTARIAEELYSRTFANGGRWKGNVGFSTTVRCEVYQCDDRPLMMWKHFSVLQTYMRGVDTLTPIGAAASGDFTYYASGWSLVRWAADQYAGDEAVWMKALVRGGNATGLANLAQLTGRPAAEMLADWSLANAVDDLPGFLPKRPQLSFPTWNMNEMMNGLAETYPGSFLGSPLKARGMSFGSFTLPVARLRAFSSSYFSFEGNQVGSQLIELRGENGELLLPGTLRVALVRVE